MPAKVYSTVDDYRVCALPWNCESNQFKAPTLAGNKNAPDKENGELHIHSCLWYALSQYESMYISIPSPRKNKTCDAGDMLSMVMHSN